MYFLRLIITLGIIFSGNLLFSQTDTLTRLFQNSYSVYELQRNSLGIYRDSKLITSNQDFHPSSVANIGMGLVSLCLADAMGWESDAADQTLVTLRSISGENPTFQPDRNSVGFFRHFIDMLTGQQAWDSEYSTIDTGILMAGALFAKTYFADDDSIAFYTEQLWESIDWDHAIADPQTGDLYLTLDFQGNGSGITKPFNEYMLVAWLAMKAEGNTPGPATQLWNNFYADPANLPSNTYFGCTPLADNPSSFLSSFVSQFPYYLCHAYTSDSAYFHYFEQARKADSTWWATQNLSNSAIWGLGAGSANHGFGYHADAINNNPGRHHSPHIIAGFLPVYPDGASDLKALYHQGIGLYTLTNNKKILWRKSVNDPTWDAPEVQGVDYASMLFGLATLPQHLGPDFFPTYNNYDFPPYSSVGVDRGPGNGSLELFPNPTKGELLLRLGEIEGRAVQVNILDMRGKVLQQKLFPLVGTNTDINLDVSDLAGGILTIQAKVGNRSWSKKWVKL